FHRGGAEDAESAYFKNTSALSVLLCFENLRSLRKLSDSLSGASDYSRAKTPRTQSDGPSPVIPNECEGSEKDFSLSRNDKLPLGGLCALCARQSDLVAV